MTQLATMVYLLKGDKILFMERQKANDTVHKQGMHIPMGGKVEKGESIEACAKREVKEESGVIVKGLTLKGIIYFRSWGNQADDWLDYLYVTQDFEGNPKDGNEGNFLWVNKKDINKLNLYAGDKIFLDYLFRYEFFVAEFEYKGFDLVSDKLLKSF